MTSFKTYLAISLSPFFVLQKFSIKMCCKRMWNAEAMWQNGWVWVTAGHQSALVGLEWLPSSSQNLLTRIDLGKMIIDPRPSFQTVWLNQKCWYLKNAQKDVECRSTFVQRPHHDLVPFSALQNNDLFLWSVGINSYHNNAHISKLSGF